MKRARDASGSTLLEALVASLILTTGLLVMAQLIAIATASNLVARQGTVAAILAEQKMEELLADIPATSPPPTSPWSLQSNTPGFVDHVDEWGAVVGNAARPPGSALHTRRWSVEPLSATGGQMILVQVLVTRVRNRGAADRGTVGRLPGEARLVTIRRAP